MCGRQEGRDEDGKGGGEGEKEERKRAKAIPGQVSWLPESILLNQRFLATLPLPFVPPP